MAVEQNQALQQKTIVLSIQDAAKQICTIIPILQAAYFAAISMTDIKKALWQEPRPDLSIFLFYAGTFLAPVILWLTSFVMAIKIFVPSRISPEISQISDPSSDEEVVDRKYRLLRLALWFLAGGLAWLAVNFILYILVIPPPVSK